MEVLIVGYQQGSVGQKIQRASELTIAKRKLPRSGSIGAKFSFDGSIAIQYHDFMVCSISNEKVSADWTNPDSLSFGKSSG